MPVGLDLQPDELTAKLAGDCLTKNTHSLRIKKKLLVRLLQKKG